MEEGATDRPIREDFFDVLPVMLCLILVGGIQLLFVALLATLGVLAFAYIVCSILNLVVKNRA